MFQQQNQKIQMLHLVSLRSHSFTPSVVEQGLRPAKIYESPGSNRFVFSTRTATFDPVPNLYRTPSAHSTVLFPTFYFLFYSFCAALRLLCLRATNRETPGKQRYSFWKRTAGVLKITVARLVASYQASKLSKAARAEPENLRHVLRFITPAGLVRAGHIKTGQRSSVAPRVVILLTRSTDY